MGNAASIQHLVELWAAGRVEDGRDLMDPQIEWVEPPENVSQNIVAGPDAALDALANWNDQFDSLRVETTELREADDRVLHAMRQFATFRGSDAEIAGHLYMVWWFRDGKAVRMEMYNTSEQAEAAFAR